MCNECKEMQEKLDAIIESHKDEPGCLIPVLHETQKLYGYLPEDVLKTISKGLNMPLSEIYGVATFYSQFSLQRKGKYRINVCLGTACYVKGSNDIMNTFRQRLSLDIGECTDDGLFSLEACRCVGACGLAPVVMVNDDVYGRLSVEDVDGIIEKYQQLEAASQGASQSNLEKEGN